ncbi:hypothetical protein BWI06_RS23015 [Vibrio parahaemolyticus]|uniref:hypothetical protein n=1 Tax=Vibrio parahaemolyticus TaxID=670 RepID=UPI0011212E09|nr:hypothetical protein [Vibrio parahaemolyticus]EJE4561549.1 hypothetical protein [Vibrio parahaemolyticus]EJG1768157.1 hypothetical protein [Vibrio parahaemolyticus]ELA7366400.1 hypothetical protein [Vibrio parahaemolyticus]HCE5173164.1 hypothetical protein [Vibrio parahaemolyticus]HCE5274238.1 hypothetical protein [Vibrio parahaemolyticus]
MKFGGRALLPLNAALVAYEKIAAKTECLGLIVRVLCSILHFELRDLGSRKLRFVLFLVWFAVSEADLLVESQLCGIVSPKGLLVLSVRFLRRCLFQVVSATNALKLRLI